MKQFRKIALIMALAVAALSVQVVGAQPTLVASDPLAGSVIPETPDEVRVIFDMELDSELSRVELINSTGSTIADGGVDTANPDVASMSIDLPDEVPPGEYTVRWVVSGVNGPEQQEIEGEYTFTIDPTATATSSETVVIEDPVGTIEPDEDDATETDEDDDDLIGQGALIVGGVAIVVAIAVVATIGRRRYMR